MVDEETAPEAVPEVGDVAPDPSMEVAAEPGPEEPAQPEVGTAVEVVEDGGDITVEPEPEPEPEPEAEAEAEAEESSPAEDQANYEPPPALDQASYVQGLMVAGSNEGQDARRESLVRNRERRRLQQEAIRRSNQG